MQIPFKITMNKPPGQRNPPHRCRVYFNGSWRPTKKITCHVATQSCIDGAVAFTMDGVATKIVVTADEIIIA